MSDRIVTKTRCGICGWASSSQPATLEEATDMGHIDGLLWTAHSEATGHQVCIIETFDPDQDMAPIMTRTLVPLE